MGSPSFRSFVCEPVTMKVEARTQKVQKSPVSCSAPQVGRVRTSPPGASSLPWRFLFQIIVGPFFRICMITCHCTKFFPQNTCHWCDLEWSDHNSEILGFPHLWLPCGESSQETLKDVARSSPVFPSRSNYRMNCCFILLCFSYTGFPSLGPWAAGMLINLTPWLIPPTLTPSPVISGTEIKQQHCLPPPQGWGDCLTSYKGSTNPQDGAPSSLTGLSPSSTSSQFWSFHFR